MLALCCSALSEATITGSGYTEGSVVGEELNSRALVNPTNVCLADSCSSWLWRKHPPSCECGNKLHNVVLCKNDSEEVAVLQCYCMYSDNISYNVGSCLYGCFTANYSNNNTNLYTNLYTPYSTNESLNNVCIRSNRRGPLCGQCIDSNHAIPAYSFSLKCKECSFKWTNILKYIAVAYGPLTLFYIMIVVCSVSIHSAPLHGYIFVAQMIATSVSLRLLQTMNEIHDGPQVQNASIAFAATVYGVWNLDFFRFVYTPHCLHPSLSTLTIMSLDYLIAVYPFVIMLLTYVLVLLHSRGYRVIILMWKPFKCFFARFRENLDIRTSLVDAFGTFFSLSYVKFLSTTVDLMATTRVHDVQGRRHSFRMYYDGELEFMKGTHLIYASISLTCFTIFNILPLILLLLYPRRSFQKRIPLSVRRVLHPFMDILLGIYRDGTDGGRDCRFFVVVYPIARIITYFIFMVVLNAFVFLFITVIMTATAVLVAIIKPYKSKTYNTVDMILLVILALVYASLTSYFFAYSVAKQDLSFSRVMMALTVSLPFIYAFSLAVYRVWKSFKIRRKLLRMGQCLVLCCGRLYFYLLERNRERCEMDAFPSNSERTHLIPPNTRDLND